MKCLSLKQPFAFLLASGRKTIELRKWNTHFRGKFLIHASLKPDLGACKELGIDPKELVYGAVIGSATIYGIKDYESVEEFMQDSKKHLATKKFYPQHGFLIKDAVKFDKPIPMKGQLNFFDVKVKI